MHLASDLALALDPVALAQRLGFEPDDWQRDLLRSTSQRVMMLCARQTGKSTIAALMALHQALYYPGSLVLLLSPSQRQSGELFRKVKDFYARLGDAAVDAEAESVLRLELTNGSRIVSLPGKEATIRGYSGVSLLIVDEAARVPDDLYMATRPMLAVSGGRLVLLSTPFGKRGFFHHEWTEAPRSAGWKRVKVLARECPRIDPDWLERERQAIGDWWYRQEYLCEFVETDDQVFRYDEIMAAFTSDVRPLFV